jgi:hypothetical protein
MHQKTLRISPDRLVEAAVVGVDLALEERTLASLSEPVLDPGTTVGYISPPPDWP